MQISSVVGGELGLGGSQLCFSCAQSGFRLRTLGDKFRRGKPDDEFALVYARPAVDANHIHEAGNFCIDIHGLEGDELCWQREYCCKFLRGNGDNFYCLRIRFRLFAGCGLCLASAANDG